MRRDILSIPDAKHVGLTTYDAKDPDTTYPPITALRPPKGAPNVLVVVLDDTLIYYIIVRMEFKYDGGGLGKGGDVTPYCDGKSVGQGRVERTQPMIYSADEACDVGADTGSPASPDYGPTGNKFSGQIDWVQIDIGDDSQDHLIKAEDRLTIAMARQ